MRAPAEIEVLKLGLYGLAIGLGPVFKHAADGEKDLARLIRRLDARFGHGWRPCNGE